MSEMTTPRFDLTRRAALHGMALTGLAALTGCAEEEPRLSLAIWQDYLGETTLADFRKASGIEVTVTAIAHNAELYDKLKAGGHGFDVVVPSSQWTERMVREDLLLPLSHARLPNLKNLETPFADMAYDPGNAHSVPYTWLAMGIGYRRSKVSQPPASWKALLESPALLARTGLPGDPALLFRLAAKALGFSANLFNPDRLKAAEALLAAAVPQAKALHRDGGADLLLAGGADLVAVWNGDLAQVALEDRDIAFMVPGEGALLTCDCLAIPASAARPGNAHQFIDFILSAEGGAGVAGTLWFPSPNAAAKALLPADYSANPVLFPRGGPVGMSELIGDNPGLEAQFAAAMARIAPETYQPR